MLDFHQMENSNIKKKVDNVRKMVVIDVLVMWILDEEC